MTRQTLVRDELENSEEKKKDLLLMMEVVVSVLG